jgi:ATPase subunit of ABC transporter with duplicated ATPase domains
MLHCPIKIQDLSLTFPHTTCFEHFSTLVKPGDRIAIVGPNGAGKSSLLKIIQGLMEPSDGLVLIPEGVVFGYVPQIITEFNDKSGAQRFNQALTQAMALHPNVLCLDEPTNHLDSNNRHNLMRLLNNYAGTLIMVTHDPELLRLPLTALWYIEEGQISVFSGNYDALIAERIIAHQQRMQKLEALKKEFKKTNESMIVERQRSASRKRANIHEQDKLLRSKMKETAATTLSKKQRKVGVLRKQIQESLRDIRVPEVIIPKFNLEGATLPPHAMVVEIREGSCGYSRQAVLSDINLRIGATERVAVIGENGSGKSTLIKAIAQKPECLREGMWHMPPTAEIGYLDQHYSSLDQTLSVYETIAQNAPSAWSMNDIRAHLNNFLFRKNEQVQALVAMLSGGERARLSLALLAVKAPKLLLLDEVTNNLDLPTREHVKQVLQEYPGAMLIISHDEDFLRSLNVDAVYEVKKGNVHYLLDE